VIAPFITEATHSIQEKTISTFLNLQGQVSITHLSDEQLKRVISSLTFVESTLKKGPEAAKKAFEFLSKQADSAKDPAEARLYLMLFDKLIFESALSLKSKKDEQSEMLTRYATKAIALYYQMTREISPDTYPALDEAFIRSLIELSKKSTQNPEDFKAYCIAACDLLPLENPLETYLVSTLLLNKMKECSLYAKKPEEVQKLYTTTWVKEVGDDYHVDWMGSVDKHQQLITPPATPTDTLSRRSSSSSLRTPSPTPFLAAHQSGKSSPQPDSEQGIHPK
jgi:hypothetical protein